jgi:hypothetical protein
VFHEKQQLPIDSMIFQAPDNNPSKPMVVIKFCSTDEEAGASYSDWSIVTAINSLVKMEDCQRNELHFFPSIDEGIRVGFERFKTCIPPTEVIWKELESDAAFSALMFYGNMEIDL